MDTYEQHISKIKYCPVCGFSDETIFEAESLEDNIDNTSNGQIYYEIEEDTGATGGNWICQNCYHEVSAYWYDENSEFSGQENETTTERKLFLSIITTIFLFMAFIYFFV